MRINKEINPSKALKWSLKNPKKQLKGYFSYLGFYFLFKKVLIQTCNSD